MGTALAGGLANFNDVMKAISAIIFSGASSGRGVAAAAHPATHLILVRGTAPTGRGGARAHMRTGMILGQTVQLAPDFSKARTAAAAIFGLLDRKPAIDSSDPSGRKLAVVEGRITFQDVKFQYPNRPDVPVLRGLSFTLEPGKTLALVGSSGCGKSTVIALVERFYDPASGQILVEGVDTRDLNLSWLRSQVGLVQQEPILFLGSYVGAEAGCVLGSVTERPWALRRRCPAPRLGSGRTSGWESRTPRRKRSRPPPRRPTPTTLSWS